MTQQDPERARRIAIAQRVADAHRGIDDDSLLSFVSGSTVDNIADSMSDIDMTVVFAGLPDQAILRNACRSVDDTDWFWTLGNVENGLVAAFKIDGIEVQVGYDSQSNVDSAIDDLLIKHNPDTPHHKFAEGVLKAVPLAAARQLATMQTRLADFPQGLAEAMVRHGLKAQVSWSAVAQLIHRDTELWCRDLQVDGCYRLLQILCGLNRRYFSRFQVKRVHRLVEELAIAPRELADRIDRLLSESVPAAFSTLHCLEGEVLDLISQQMPQIELRSPRESWDLYSPS